MKQLGLYLVTEPGPRLSEIVEQSVAGGVTMVQLRDKESPSPHRAQAARELFASTSRLGVPLVVNDDVDAATEADGVHLGLDDLTPREARSRLGPSAIIGWSLNDLGQLDQVEQLAACTYLALSPVFATTTKPDHSRPWGLDGVRSVRRQVDLPLVGIGGIDRRNAGDVIAAGTDGVAVVSAICRAAEPYAATRDLRVAIDAARAAAGDVPVEGRSR